VARMILSRRAVLRGALVGGGLATLPLPRLNAMMNGNGNAYASGEALRRVYGTWFWANGVFPGRWTPSATGSDFPLSEQLMPFANLKRNLTVVSGMAIKTGRAGAHLYHAGALTGAAGSGKTVDLPTIDQLIANKIGGDTAFKSLELGVCGARPTGTTPLYYNISWTGPNAPNPADMDPHSVWNRLFGPGSPGAGLSRQPTATTTDDGAVTTVRRSVLDAIGQDARDLSVRVGVEDRQRLEKHLDGLRALEKRLGERAGGATGCQPGTDPAMGPNTKAEAPPELNKAMADLLIAALSCDLTRVFTFTFNYAGSHLYFRNLGPNLSKDFHTQICHAEAGDQPNFNTGVLYTMGCWAYLLEGMNKIQEGDGTLLDNSLVYGSTCVAWGKAHSYTLWPVMMFGRAGGALKGNTHVAAPDDNVAKVAFTIGNVFGLDQKQFGKAAGLVTDEVAGIRA
jgi:hypothetical protein